MISYLILALSINFINLFGIGILGEYITNLALFKLVYYMNTWAIPSANWFDRILFWYTSKFLKSDPGLKGAGYYAISQAGVFFIKNRKLTRGWSHLGLVKN